jgi:AcrR family transcriptional regulator
MRMASFVVPWWRGFARLAGMVAHSRNRRVRKNPEERKREITQVTARLVSERGFNGISLRDVADAVGMSQPGLLHYVGNKDGLLSLLITDLYDTSGTPSDFIASGLPGSDPRSLLFPSYLRFLVRHNSGRRMMVQLYVVLESESLNPQHPLYGYFRARPEEVWKRYSQFPWRIPEQLGPWEESMRPRVRQCIEAMDGIQLRWLRDPPIDLYDEWIAFERLLFPLPLWESYI